MDIDKILKQNKIKFEKNVPLKEHTTTRVGGPAKYFIRCKSEEDLIKIYELSIKYEIPKIILGKGSNLLISDEGFEGLAILNEVKETKLTNNIFYVSSGYLLFDFIKHSLELGFSGMEKVYGIPGTVGGGIYGNAGAYGASVSDNILRVKVFDGKKTFWVSKKDCHFGYRDSIFKKDKKLILGAEFLLKKDLDKEGTAEAGEILSDRLKKYKYGICCPGSFFKNIESSKLDKKVLNNIPEEKIVFGKIPAGYLLESIDAKGTKIGDIKVSDTHANFLINEGNGSAKDYFKLVMFLREKVFKKYGIKLEPEVQMVGFDNMYSYKNVAILGFGIEGKDALEFLLKKGANVTVFDKKEKTEFNTEKYKNVNFVFGEKYLSKGLKKFDLIVRSPGVYRYKNIILEAEKEGVSVTSTVKLFSDNCPGKIIGVTGTKGKGTTASLIYEILKKSKKDVYLVGNIGNPSLKILNKLNENSIIVMELSSFQLIDMTRSPNISVVLNITEDHLDWHKDKEEYVLAKENIIKYQNNSDYSVINYDYDLPRSFSKLTKSKVYFVSRKTSVKGCYVYNNNIILNIDNKEINIGNTKDLFLRGEHNWENICSAIMASYIAGSDLKSIREVVFSFKGLEHRLEFVRSYKNIEFYNDSFATGPQPTIAAVNSFNKPLTLILGGYDKGLNYESLAGILKNYKHKLQIVLIGDLEEKLFALLSAVIDREYLYKLGKKTMDIIVKKAVQITPENGIILLSPAAASFDMFKDYKERGNMFKNSVMNLK